jgi:2-oxoglutarate ferredoxin oxidoreductase subunit gamma
MQKSEIILAGIGGQGLLLAGLILGDSAAIAEGKYAAQVESYAPLARGGASKSEIIISDEEIDYPHVRKADILVALAQDAYDSSIKQVKPEGLAIIDGELVKNIDDNHAHLSLGLTEIAKTSTGKTFTVSIVALGVLARITGLVSLPSLLASINFRAPNGTEEINRKAAEAGFNAAEQHLAEAAGKKR